MSQVLKLCGRCKLHHPKTREFFSTNSARPGGLKDWCKKCDAEYARRYHGTKERRDYFREWEKKNRKKRSEQHRKNLDPIKAKARTTLKNAIRDGKIKRQNCSKCGAPKAHGHHTDYSKPLLVVWLCLKHHAEEHRKYD